MSVDTQVPKEHPSTGCTLAIATTDLLAIIAEGDRMLAALKEIDRLAMAHDSLAGPSLLSTAILATVQRGLGK